MAERYPGGYITKTPPAPTSTAAPGVWTLEQAMQNVKAGTWPPNGPYFIEDVFSTYLYTGDGNDKTITNNINLSGKGGLVWIKGRDSFGSHVLADTVNGVNKYLSSNSTAAITSTTSVSAFSTTGFTVSTDSNVVQNGVNFSSWSFREQPKFFDVVTFTTSSTTNTNQRISHNLGSTPGCIIVKSTNNVSGWPVWHRSLPTATSTYFLLNTSDPESTYSNCWGTSGPTSTDFGVNTNFFGTSSNCVAYIFAHNAGGFGLTGSDNVITCGSFNASSGAQDINLGYEPQLVFLRESTNGGKWEMIDTMRGFIANGDDVRLAGNSTAVENTLQIISPSATGFRYYANLGGTVVYVAIRRGPMKTPTDATKVFAVTSFTGVDATQTAGFTVDFVPNAENLSGTIQWQWVDRLRGKTKKLESNSSSAEGTVSNGLWDSNTQVRITSSGNSYKRLYPMFARAPGFFDVVCVTLSGNGNVTHGLGVVPELIIGKRRSSALDWWVYSATTGASNTLTLNSTAASTSSSNWGSTTPTSSVFTVGGGPTGDWVFYLFASVSGVSKVGSYTGTGALQTVNCGFTTGARFVLIKRTDSTGDWYVWNSATGIVAGNDPYVLFNSTAAEVTTTDWVDTYSLGFELSNAVGNNVNINTATYIFLAIA